MTLTYIGGKGLVEHYVNIDNNLKILCQEYYMVNITSVDIMRYNGTQTSVLGVSVESEVPTVK